MSTAYQLLIDALRDHGSTVKDDGSKAAAQCPAHDDGHASLSVAVGKTGDRTVVHCHAGCQTGDVLAAIGMGLKDLFDEQTIYTYPGGAVVHRKPGKRFWQDGNKTDRSLFRSDELPEDTSITVYVVEGEKDVNTTKYIENVHAVSPRQGANTDPGRYDWSVLKGRPVVIVADRDKSGYEHAAKVAALLANVAASVHIAEAAEGKDLTDHIQNGHSVDELVPVHRATESSDGAELLDAVQTFLARFVAYPSAHALVAHVLWIAHTWLMDAWESTPRIAFLSPEPGSGKSRALEVTEPLVPRPVHAVNTTPAYLFRKVSDEAGPPTILYDEIDTVFGPKAKDNEDIRGMLNAGHRKGAMAGRCVMRGKVVETEELPAYCAVALAGLDDLPDTIMTRSVVVRMRRRAPGERIEPWRLRVNGPEAERLRARIATWCTSVADQLTGDFWPELPEQVADRDADVWEALVTVADLAGGEWPRRARGAAVALVAASRQRVPSIGVLLLRDIKTVFAEADTDELTTEHLLSGLNRLEESPWATIRKGEPLNGRSLSQRLDKYGIGSKMHAGERGLRGYTTAQFTDTWSRYVPSESATSATPAPELPADGAHVADVADESQDTPDEPEADPPENTALFDANNQPTANSDDRRCGCGNKLLTPDARASGRCRPCRDKAMAGYDQ